MIRALGCMRLSTVATRDDAGAHAALTAAIDHGVTLLDTADAYAHDDADRGHNERLVAAACAARPMAQVRIVTKGGLVRPGGRWQPDGRAAHLAAAAAASRARLPRIDLYLLHVIDPQVPLATSVRALARLQADGVVAAIGLANVGRAPLEAALAIAPIAAIEIELSPRKTDALRGGLVAWCAARGVEVLAHRPFGGAAAAAKLFAHGAVAATAARLGASSAAVVLAWLRAHGVVPLPGATQVATAIDAATALTLDDQRRRAAGPWLAREGAALDRDEALVVARRLELAPPAELRRRWQQHRVAAADQLGGLGLPAEPREGARRRVDLGVLERRVEPHAAHRGAVAARRGEHVGALGPRRVGVVEHDPGRAAGERVVERARQLGQRAAALVAVEPQVAGLDERRHGGRLAGAGDAHHHDHLGSW